MKTLAGLVRELDDQLSACTRCGMCQAVCPLFRETGRESGVARGKLAILKGLMQEAFREPQRSLEELSRCLLCGSCEANCPSGVRVLEIFLKARAILTGYLGMPPAKRLAFRNLVSHPARFDRFTAWAARMQGLFIKPADDLLGTSCARFTSPLADRHFKALAPVPFHRQIQGRPAAGKDRKGRVLFFYGCLIDKVYPEIGRAVLKTLEHFRVEVIVPEGQGCCGIPALSAGDLQTFQTLVDYNVERFAREPCAAVVTACPTCAATIKKIWPVLARSAGQQTGLAGLAENTVDITDFLVNRIGIGPAAFSGSKAGDRVVTYHDPCHLRKSLGVSVPPRLLLKSLAGYVYRELTEAEACCGCGGSFTLEHYELSRAVGQRKLENMRQSGAVVAATACPACLLQISDLLSRGGDRIRVRHVIEILADSLEAEKEGSR